MKILDEIGAIKLTCLSFLMISLYIILFRPEKLDVIGRGFIAFSIIGITVSSISGDVLVWYNSPKRRRKNLMRGFVLGEVTREEIKKELEREEDIGTLYKI